MGQETGILLALAAVFSLVNHRWLKWPATIGLMAMSLVTSLILVATQDFLPGLYQFFLGVVSELDFSHFLIDVALGFLLFAGAMQINLRELYRQERTVLVLATLGTLISTLVVGGLIFLLCLAFGVQMSFLYSLLFGALISPTDPVAVLAILEEIGIRKELRIRIEGESLFNDGVGVVIFLTLLSMVSVQDNEVGWQHIGIEFLQEIGGGILAGLILAWIGERVIRANRDEPKISLLVTVAIVGSGYSFASLLQISGPLAMVVAGLGVGWQLGHLPSGNPTRRHLQIFWGSLDNMLNAILFVMIGLLAHTIQFSGKTFLLALLAIPVVLAGRFLAVAIAFNISGNSRRERTANIILLVWGGLRGGLPVALALSIDRTDTVDEIILITYVVAVFSILVQGLTLPVLIRRIG